MHLRAAVNNDSTDHASRLLLADLHLERKIALTRRLLKILRRRPQLAQSYWHFPRAPAYKRGSRTLHSAYFDRSEEQKTNDPRRLTALTSVYLDAGEFDRATRVLASASLDESERAGQELLARPCAIEAGRRSGCRQDSILPRRALPGPGMAAQPARKYRTAGSQPHPCEIVLL